MDTITGDTMAAAAASLSGGSTDTSGSPDTSVTSTPDSTTATTDAASPAADPPGAVQTAPATTVQDAGSDQTDETGPIPVPRHKAILERARSQHQQELQRVQERVTQFEQTYQSLQPVLQWQQQFQQDPIAAFVTLANEMEAHPELGPRLRSQAARWLRGGNGGRQPEAVDQMPGPDLQGTDSQGNVVTFYSAEQQAKRDAWLEQRMTGQFEQRIAPLAKAEAQRQEEAVARQLWDGAIERQGKVLSKWRQRAGFTEHEGEIKALLTSRPGTSLDDAYFEIVVPKLSQTQRQQVLSDLRNKAAASTVNPGQAATSLPSPVSNMREAVERSAKQHGWV
jgi:hypothetical protein